MCSVCSFISALGQQNHAGADSGKKERGMDREAKSQRASERERERERESEGAKRSENDSAQKKSRERRNKRKKRIENERGCPAPWPQHLIYPLPEEGIWVEPAADEQPPPAHHRTSPRVAPAGDCPAFSGHAYFLRPGAFHADLEAHVKQALPKVDSYGWTVTFMSGLNCFDRI